MSTAVFGAPEFKASSGRIVKAGEDGSLSIDHKRGYLSPEVVMDVEQWAQAKHDEELGRWRWPENPQFVVYPFKDGSGCTSLSEATGVSSTYLSRGAAEDSSSYLAPAALAYFEAHPERKPWHDAKPGEGWAITLGGDERLATVEDSYFWIGSEAYAVRDVEITDARRIWPEDAS